MYKFMSEEGLKHRGDCDLNTAPQTVQHGTQPEVKCGTEAQPDVANLHSTIPGKQFKIKYI